jgi:sporulation protein YlmC with PRC-barrel domain
MDIVRDVLDKQVVDRNGREVGRVDSLVVEVHEGQPPRVIALEMGPPALAYRIGPRTGRLVTALAQAFGAAGGRALRIPLGAVIDIGAGVTVDLSVGQTTAAVLEQRLRRWIRFIPGGS